MVIASDRYTAADAADAVEVEYEELPAIVDPHKAMDADAPIIRIQCSTRLRSCRRRRPNTDQEIF